MRDDAVLRHALPLGRGLGPPREVTLSFMDMLIALLLSYFRLSFTYVSLMRRLETAEEYM